MNAALGVSLMLLGHYMLPTSDDTTPKLNEDMSTPVTTQDDEQRFAQQHVRLPAAPTMAVPDTNALGRDGYRGDLLPRYPTSTLPGATTNRNNNLGQIPLAPTDPNAGYGGGSLTQPRVGTPTGQATSGYQGYQSNIVGPNGGGAGNHFNPGGIGQNGGVGQFVAPTAQGTTGLTAPTLGNYRAPTASQYIGQGSYGTMGGNGYGTSVGGNGAGGTAGYGYQSGAYGYGSTNTSVPDNRPFANANPLAPVISPYLNLYNTPTNNGTVDAYHSSVLPALQQQAYNTQTTARIQGVQTAPMHALGPNGASGVQMGNGMADPSQFINYGSSFNNTGNYFPVNPYGQ